MQHARAGVEHRPDLDLVAQLQRTGVLDLGEVADPGATSSQFVLHRGPGGGVVDVTEAVQVGAAQVPPPLLGSLDDRAVAEAGAVYALVTGDEDAGMRGGDTTAHAGASTEVASAKAASDAASLTMYPNPTSGVVSIALTLDAPVDASVEVYDVLGREVVVLQEGSLNAGHHALSFDAVGLPAGVYVVRFVAGDAVKTRRITVVR